jgi:hypothetical protein
MLPERQPTRFLYFATAAAEFLQSGVAVTCSGVLIDSENCIACSASVICADTVPTSRRRDATESNDKFERLLDWRVR